MPVGASRRPQVGRPHFLARPGAAMKTHLTIVAALHIAFSVTALLGGR
ncbi:MAG: hypothetical protein ACREKN_01450 [Longimicrobiaceae bacterium]